MKGVLIPGTENFRSDYSEIIRITDDLSTSQIVIEDIIFESRRIYNLLDPLLNDQAATKNYVDNNSGSAGPGLPLNSVQFNNGGVFTGTSELTFLSNVLTSNRFSNGTIQIINNKISGISDPTSNSHIINKKYADRTKKINNSSNLTLGSVNYSVVEVFNNFLIRNSQTNSLITDVFPSASQIINDNLLVIGSSFTFSVYNSSTQLDSIINFSSGVDIIGNQGFYVYPGYCMNILFLVTGASELTMYYTSSNFLGSTNWFSEISGSQTSIGTIRVTDYFLNNNLPITAVVADKITPTQVKNKIVKYNPSIASTVYLDTPDKFMGVVEGTDFIDIPFIFSTGGVDFYIKNTNGANNLTLAGTTGTIAWTMDPNSTMIIPPNSTGHFMIFLEVTNYPEIASLLSAKVYSLGISSTS